MIAARRRVIHIVSIFALIGCGGLVFGQNAAEGEIEGANEGLAPPELLSIDGVRIETVVGESFEIRTRIGAVPPDEVRVLIPELPSGIRRTENPTVVSRGRDTIEVRIPFIAATAGRYIVEGVGIVTDDGLREVEPVLLIVATGRDGPVPLQGTWRVPDETIVQSQSVPIILSVVGAEDYIYPEEISYRAPDTGLFEEVRGIGEVTTRSVNIYTLYDIPVAGFLFTPATAGEVTVPAAEIVVGDQTVLVQPKTVTVAPLPEGVARSNAVGSFEIEASIDQEQVEVGETVTLTLSVVGTGNLPVLDYPEVEVDGFNVVDRNERVTMDATGITQRGYRGRREQTIRLEANETARVGRIDVADFVYLDPQIDEVVRVAGRRFETTIIALEENVQAGTELPDIPLLTVQELLSPRWYRFQEVSWLFYLLFLGPVFFGVSALWSVRKSKTGSIRGAAVLSIVPFLLGLSLFPVVDRERIENAMNIVEEGRPAVAGVLFALEIDRNEWHAGLHYNRGILGMRTNRPVVATYHLRRAVRLAPDNERFREAMERSSRYFGLSDQVPIPRYPRLDYFILALLVLWTMFWIVLSARRRLRNTLGLVVVVMGFVGVGVGAIWSWSLDRQIEGVVREEIHVRRIPDETAVPWIALTEAQAVRIELLYDDFFLVRTRAGMTGWVPQEAVLSRNRSSR